jgi:hypothetical protein
VGETDGEHLFCGFSPLGATAISSTNDQIEVIARRPPEPSRSLTISAACLSFPRHSGAPTHTKVWVVSINPAFMAALQPVEKRYQRSAPFAVSAAKTSAALSSCSWRRGGAQWPA